MKRKTGVLSGITLALVGIYLLAPLLAVIIYSFFFRWNSILPSGFTLEFYKELVTNANFLPLIANSLWLAALSVLITLILLLLSMYAVIVYFPGLEKYVQMLCLLPYTIQGIILATSYLSLFSDAPGIFSNRIFLLICAYCVIILPYMYQGIRNSLRTVPVLQIIESARILGSSSLYAFFAIIVPNILSGITVSLLLSLGLLFGEFAIINILASSYIQTLTVYMANSANVSGHMTCAIVVISFTVMTVFSIASLLSRKNKQTVR